MALRGTCFLFCRIRCKQSRDPSQSQDPQASNVVPECWLVRLNVGLCNEYPSMTSNCESIKEPNWNVQVAYSRSLRLQSLSSEFNVPSEPRNRSPGIGHPNGAYTRPRESLVGPQWFLQELRVSSVSVEAPCTTFRGLLRNVELAFGLLLGKL